MSEWFIAHAGERKGPISAKEVTDLLSKGEIHAHETLAWKEGMGDWKKLAESGLLAEASMAGTAQRAPEPDALPLPTAIAEPNQFSQPQAPSPFAPPEENPSAAVNPYSAPSSIQVQSNDYQVAGQYPGIGRLVYFCLQFGIAIVSYVLLFVLIFASFTASSGSSSSLSSAVATGLFIFFAVMAISMVGYIWIGVKRVQNLGMSGWAVLWSLVPIINIWIAWRMFACPAGYHDHKQLDTAGKVMTGLFIAFFALSLLMNIAAIFMES